MSVYRVYSKNFAFTIPTFYKCSRCNKFVITKSRLNLTSQYNDKGTFTQRSLDKRREQALSSTFNTMKSQVDDLCNNKSTFIYRKAKLDVKCPHCNFIELWSKYSNSVFSTTLIICFIIFLMACYFGAAGFTCGIIFSIAVLIGLAWAVYEILFEKQLRKNLEINPVIFALDFEELKQKVLECPAYKNNYYEIERLFSDYIRENENSNS